MDGHRIDSLAREFARRSTRRRLLGRFGAAGAATALLGTTVRAPAWAHNATAVATPASTGPASAVGKDGRCLLLFEATVRQGPSKGKGVVGVLALAVDASGQIDGELLRGHGGRNRVVGQTVGRAINLLIDLGDGQILYGVGTADSDVAACQIGDLGGPLVGPAPGDAGDWTIVTNRPCIGIQGQQIPCPGGGLGQPTPISGGGGGGGTVLGGDGGPTTPCTQIALDNCNYVCNASHLSGNCDTYCAEALFCPE
jgi:hypothetical protein